MSNSTGARSSITAGSTADPIEPARRTRYGVAMQLLLVSAFTLSLGHTVYAWRSGLESADFTVTTPLTWVFYAVAFAMAALARSDARVAQVALAGYLVAVLAVSVFYYPTTFTLEQQTTFGWFENDLYTGLLLMSLSLSVLRMRRQALVP